MKQAILVAGLGYGDEGKGTTVDWLCRDEHAKLVVRYNGGAQAGHNVVTDDGRHHTFSQFGSGTFAGVPTLLSRHMLVNPVTLVPEARHLTELGLDKPCSMLHVERDALVTTPYHMAVNRLREMARTDRHGSCGLGIGETVSDWLTNKDEAIFVRDLQDRVVATRKLRNLQSRLRESVKTIPIATPAMQKEVDVLEKEEAFERILDYFTDFCNDVHIVGPEWLLKQMQDGTILFEGAQGVLLDESYGFQPHTTWSDCTYGNAYKLLDWYDGDVLRLGILRAYATRHGAGPFVTEDEAFKDCIKSDHNVWTDWQQGFRAGAFDLVAARYALDVIGGIDGLMLTHMDQVSQNTQWRKTPICVDYCLDSASAALEVQRPADYDHQCKLTELLKKVTPTYEHHSTDTDFLLEYTDTIINRLGVKLFGTSWGPTARFKMRRADLQAKKSA